MVVAVALVLVVAGAAIVGLRFRRHHAIAKITPRTKLSVLSSPSRSTNAGGVLPRSCSVHAELEVQAIDVPPIVSRGLHVFASYEGPASPKRGSSILATDFTQKLGGWEFDVSRLAPGDSLRYVRDILVPVPDWMPRGSIVTIGSDLVVDTAWNNIDRITCQTRNYGVGLCDATPDGRARATCRMDCRVADDRIDANGQPVETVVHNDVSIRLDDCSVIQVTP